MTLPGIPRMSDGFFYGFVSGSGIVGILASNLIEAGNKNAYFALAVFVLIMLACFWKAMGKRKP